MIKHRLYPSNSRDTMVLSPFPAAMGMYPLSISCSADTCLSCSVQTGEVAYRTHCFNRLLKEVCRINHCDLDEELAKGWESCDVLIRDDCVFYVVEESMFDDELNAAWDKWLRQKKES